MRRNFGLAITAAFVLGVSGIAGAATQTDTSAWESAVKVGPPSGASGIQEHLRALQEIADLPDSHGTRSTGSYGHEQSADYVISRLDSDYWTVSSQPFTAAVYDETAPPVLSVTGTGAPAWTQGQDYQTMSYSGTNSFSDVPVTIVKFVAPNNQASNSDSGCDPSHFPSTTPGTVAIVQRGTCDFSVKAKNAEAAGALAIVIYNEGTIGDADRNGIINGTAGAHSVGADFPVLESTYAAGKYLVDNPSSHVNLSAFGFTTDMQTRNVVAQTKTGRTDRVVVSGAHLDSVPEGPGINDDGTGTATQIELAEELQDDGFKPRNQIRFIWFSGEEQGLFGSEHYATTLSKKGVSSIQAMLDFDMLASPNWGLHIYDGDGSENPTAAGPNGSGTVEAVFQKWFDKKGHYTIRDAFDGRSDYDGFTAVGIPAGGITTGAEVHKTTEQQAHWGGVVDPGLAGQYDPCYHLACDSFEVNGHPDNISDEALGIMSDAVTNAVITFAQTTSAVNGTDKGSDKSVKSTDWKGNFRVR